MKTYSLIIFLAFLFGCTNSNKSKNETGAAQIKNAEWILGQWENISEEGKSVENWEKLNDSIFTGDSYFLSKGDTAFSEEIRLEVINDTLYYVPTVKDQNSGQPVYFRLKTTSVNKIVFENEKHDFPKLISYTRVSEDSLVAEISGEINGNFDKRQFPMKRMK